MTDFDLNSESNSESPNIYENPAVKELMRKVGELSNKVESLQTDVKKADDLRREMADARRAVGHQKEKTIKTIQDEYEIKKQAAIEEATADLEKKFQEYTDVFNEAQNKKWSIEPELNTTKNEYEKLKKELDAQLDALRLKEELDDLEKKWEGIIASSVWKDYIHEYQMYGAKRMVLAKRALNADEMGLGKTLQCIAAIQMTDGEEEISQSPESSAVLWVTRKNAMMNTQQEFKKWYPGRFVAVLQGNPIMRETMVEAAYNSGAVLICNYEALQSTPNIMFHDPDEVSSDGITTPENMRIWQRVVTDECHQFRSEGSLKFKNVRRVAHGSEYFWGLSGTPFLNHLSELWATLHMIDPEKYKRKYRFVEEFAHGAGEAVAPWMVDELMKRISKFTFRRRKDEVAIELPDLTRQMHYVEMTDAQREMYDSIRDNMYVSLNLGDDDDTTPLKTDNVLSWLMRLRQIALWPPSIKLENVDDISGKPIRVNLEESAKIDEAMEIIEELTGGDDKVVVFSVLNEPLKEVVRRCNALGIAAEYYDGTPAHQAALVSAFQEDDKPQVLVMNVKKAEAINLFRASHCIFLDLWWNAPTNEQAEARLHRIGQKSAVTSHIIHATESIDNFIAHKIEVKEGNFKSVFDRKELRKAIEEGMI